MDLPFCQWLANSYPTPNVFSHCEESKYLQAVSEMCYFCDLEKPAIFGVLKQIL
jgi:hypothetical protein